MTVWVVTMRRWGDPEMHSYVVGVYSSKRLAEYSGKDEREYRGGKYEADIKAFKLDADVPKVGSKE
jgi:hypothetical protein